MFNLKEKSIHMNGRLSNHYSLNMVMKQEDSIDKRDSLCIRVKLIHDNDEDSKVEMIKKEATIKLYVNDSLVAKQNIDIDTTNYNELTLVDYKEDMLIKNSTLLNIKAILEIRSKSKYLETTEIRDSFIMVTAPERKLFIDLDYRESTTLVFCTITTTLESELLEYKTNFTDWEKLDTKQMNFSVLKNR